jgi:hypothetical protein
LGLGRLGSLFHGRSSPGPYPDSLCDSANLRKPGDAK